jgi:hypothetical protein
MITTTTTPILSVHLAKTFVKKKKKSLSKTEITIYLFNCYLTSSGQYFSYNHDKNTFTIVQQFR